MLPGGYKDAVVQHPSVSYYCSGHVTHKPYCISSQHQEEQPLWLGKRKSYVLEIQLRKCLRSLWNELGLESQFCPKIVLSTEVHRLFRGKCLSEASV